MIGDVSGHGYRAALIMALAMSASAIHAQSAKDPSEMLSLLLGSMREELATTDMYISACFVVLDHANARLRFANTGHPHAFVMTSDGEMRRLIADGPALGLADDIGPAQSIPWQKGKDTLLLFTDGIVDSRSESGERLGEAKVLDLIKKNRSKSPEEIVETVFQLLKRHAGTAVNPDDLTLLVVRS
jgi:sigma-B regulation protein RsbU (phosphoserine phosphatase)